MGTANNISEKVNSIFKSDLGQQLTHLHSTSDGRVFIRHSEAKLHTEGLLDPNTNPLQDKKITNWYNEEN